MSTDIGNVSYWIAYWSGLEYEKEAVVFEDRRVSYGQLNDNINRVAHVLRDVFNIKKGDRVACLLNNCIEYYEIVFACGKIGARFVPVNIRLTGSEVVYIVENCTPKIILTETHFLPVLNDTGGKVSEEMCVNIQGDDFRRRMSSASKEEPADQAGWEDDFGIIYTSGTTGHPKGAILTHYNVKALCHNTITALAYGRDEKFLLQAPLCFTGALFSASMPMFHCGGTIVLEESFDAAKAIELIEKEKIALCACVPTMWKAISDEEKFAQADLSSLRIGIAGGAPVPVNLVKRYQQKGVVFSGGYSLTEGSGFNMYLPPEKTISKRGGYIPMMWNEIKVVNDKGEQVLPNGEVGEIIMKGAVVFKGYWNMPEATAETIRDGWLYTGDLARVDEEGYCFIVDRAKDMIVSGGLNVYPVEIENIIIAHPGVSQVAVIGIPHENWGEAVTAVVIPMPGVSISEDELIKFCRKKLADYKTPKTVVFVDEMPMTSSGKILKRTLRERYSGGSGLTTE